MSDDEIFIYSMLFLMVIGYAAYLRFWVVPRLRRKLDRVADAAVEARQAAAALPAAPTAAEESELRRIKERLKVLERIAVEKEDSLSREIEQLRADG